MSTAPKSPATPNIEKVTEEILAEFPKDVLRPDDRQAIAAILTRFAAGLTAERDAEIARLTKEKGTATAMLCEIKDRVSADDDFSADEIVEFITSHIGRFSQGPTWALNAAQAELVTDLRAQLAAAQEDSKRIDYLACSWESQMEGKQTVCYTMENVDGSFRSAIDAAKSP